MVTYKNRYGDLFTFTKQDDGSVLWEGDFKYCRIGFPNDYTKAYEQWKNDFSDTISLEDFKSIVHKYEDGCYVYDKYVRLVESLSDKIDMVDPSGGPYIKVGTNLGNMLGEFLDVVVDSFERVETGYKINKV